MKRPEFYRRSVSGGIKGWQFDDFRGLAGAPGMFRESGRG